MKIFVKDEDGTVYETFQKNENTYTFSTKNKTFELSLSESKNANDLGNLTEDQKRKITKAVFSHDDVLDQLRDAKKHKNSDFYYSGDEKLFDRLVDEIDYDR